MINIRFAAKIDTENIASFQLAMAKETENLELDKVTVLKGVAAVFDDESKGKYYVAQENNEIIASLLITYEWSDWRNSTIIWIQSVYVKPEHRGKGVFKKLYNAIYKVWQKNKHAYSGIRLYVDKSNAKAIEVYNRIGMNGEHYQVFEKM